MAPEDDDREFAGGTAAADTGGGDEDPGMEGEVGGDGARLAAGLVRRSDPRHIHIRRQREVEQPRPSVHKAPGVCPARKVEGRSWGRQPIPESSYQEKACRQEDDQDHEDDQEDDQEGEVRLRWAEKGRRAQDQP